MTDYTTEEYHQAIREIAARLDEVRPNWRGEVDTNKLNFSDLKTCLFGQLFGEWWHVFARLGLPGIVDTPIYYSPHAIATASDCCLADWVQVIVER